jgi:hypothetical protein
VEGKFSLQRKRLLEGKFTVLKMCGRAKLNKSKKAQKSSKNMWKSKKEQN